MKFTAKLIAQIINANIKGNEEVEIEGFSGIEQASQNDISFVSNKKYLKYLSTTKAGCVIVDEDINKDYIDNSSSTLLLVKNAYVAFAQLLQEYSKLTTKRISSISENSSIREDAILGKDLYVGDFTYIGHKSSIGDNTQIYPRVYIGDNVEMGKDCIIYPGVVIMDGSKIGNRVILQPGAVIGSDGFGFAPTADKTYLKIPQIGNVILEDDVEIGANTTIDRATTNLTVIKQGTKLDNLIQIAHNVHVGSNVVMAAQVGIAGSTSIGDNCMFGGQSGAINHLKLGKNVLVGSQTGIFRNIEDNEKVFGTPAEKASQYHRTLVYQKKIKGILDKISLLEKEIDVLKQKNKS